MSIDIIFRLLSAAYSNTSRNRDLSRLGSKPAFFLAPVVSLQTNFFPLLCGGATITWACSHTMLGEPLAAIQSSLPLLPSGGKALSISIASTAGCTTTMML